MIDAGLDNKPTAGRGAEPTVENAVAPIAAPAPAPKARTLIWSMLFLFACAAGALGFALTPLGSLL